jgi:hypothetical protein
MGCWSIAGYPQLLMVPIYTPGSREVVFCRYTTALPSIQPTWVIISWWRKAYFSAFSLLLYLRKLAVVQFSTFSQAYKLYAGGRGLRLNTVNHPLPCYCDVVLLEQTTNVQQFLPKYCSDPLHIEHLILFKGTDIVLIFKSKLHVIIFIWKLGSEFHSDFTHEF